MGFCKNDYYPGGMQMPGRQYTNGSSAYRYGFNGQERSTELHDNSYTADFWEYDSRIGRRWNVEPLASKYPMLSAYSTFNNNPILHADPDGADWIVTSTKGKDGVTHIKVTFTGAILNSGSTTPADVAKFKAAAQSQIKAAYTRNFSETVYESKNIGKLDGVNVPVMVPVGENKTQVTIDVNLKIIYSKKHLAPSDHLIEIVPSSYYGDKGSKVTLGQGGFYGKHLTINEIAIPGIIDNTNQKTVPHELGHTAGLFHPNEGSGFLGIFTSEQYIKNGTQNSNLMYQSGYKRNVLKDNSAGNDLTLKQVEIIKSNNDEGKLNKNNIPE